MNTTIGTKEIQSVDISERSNTQEKNDTHKFLVDVINEEEYEFICTANRIIKFIIAGTGAGKTHWLINKFCKDNSKKDRVLILCNRSALKDQTINNFSKASSSFKIALAKLGFADVSPDIIRKIKYGNVDIRTYHSLNDITIDELNEYDHIICDECHFLLQDSIFNGQCEDIMNKLLMVMNHYGRNLIMITATEFEIIELLNYLKYSENDGNLRLFDYSKEINSFDRIDFVCCTKSVKDLMNNVPNNEKCLVFTGMKKANMKKLSEEFENADYVYSRWISDKKSNSFYKDEEMTEKHQNLIKNNMFETKYLIANSSIDNGISFHDSKLRTIIIDNVFDMVQIIQMIGRKRFDYNDVNDRIVVYLVSNRNRAQQEYEKITEISNLVDDYIKLSKKETDEEKMKFNNKWTKIIGDRNRITEDGKYARQIVVYREVRDFKENFYVNRYAALKNNFNKEFMDNLMNIPIDMLDSKLPKTMKNVKGLNLKVAMFISERYGKDINEIEIDNGRRNNKIKRKAETKYNLEYELLPYIEMMSKKEYLFGEEQKEFIKTMQMKFGAGDSEENHKMLRLGSINKIIKEIGYYVYSKAKKIYGKTETVWIIEPLRKN